MKLGDSMAPIEACNVWNDVSRRKTRPPKIGEIPRHVAVDEESPGCSASKSLGQFNEVKSPISMLERSTSCQSERERSKISGAAPIIQDYLESTVSTRSDEQILRKPEELREKLAGTSGRGYDSPNTYPIDETLKVSSSMFNEIARNLTGENPSERFPGNPSLRVSESTDLRNEEASWDEEIPERIYEVRKDSALYIDETNIESLSLGDSLLAVGVESRSSRTLGSCNLREKIDESGNSRHSRPRARRESSGYFSNLGTFDEDRWITTTTDLGNQQDLVASRDISRERRRSCTKNRLPTTYNQQQQFIQPTIGPSCGQQSGKNPNLMCPTNEIEETSTSSSASEFLSVGKMSRVEMPNIEEQTSPEIEKPINFVPGDDNELNVYPLEIEDRLMNKISQLSLNNLPAKSENVYANYGPSSDEKSSDTIIVKTEDEETMDTRKKLSNKLDATSQWSPRTCSRQRRRMIVHQYSSPNITNAELEKIIERPYGETVGKRSVRSLSKIEKKSKSQTRESKDLFVDHEDADNGEIITAKMESQEDEKMDSDSRKLLPRSIKVYQLLSTQSEDRGDADSRIYDRRISLQIPRNNEDERISEADKINESTEQTSHASVMDEKKLIHAESVPILKIPSSSSLRNAETGCRDGMTVETDTLRGLSSARNQGLCPDDGTNATDTLSGSTIAGTRPIYPYCPYSPYASPQGSPRTNRKRPLRESRRVSIDSRQGALQLNQYKLLNNIGQGSYGIVKLAYNEEDETHYAMKILSKKKLMKKAGIFGRIAPGRKGVSNPLAKVYREIALLKKLDHPNVVKLVEVLDDPDEDNLYLVFELVQKGEVLQLPTETPLDEETARRHFRDVVMGVEYLHYQRIVHRDIKPSNLLVDSEGRVKVADLGVSAELRADGELLSGSAGTPAFAAPETTTPGAQYSGTLCDVWSMGVTLYSLVTGKVPWDGAGSIIGVQSAVRSEPLRFPDRPDISESLGDLISRILAKDPAKRITLAEIKEHSWLTKGGREPLPNEADNCRLPVTVTDEEVARVVTRVPKLDTLILIKTMLKQHSFQNPFLPRRISKLTGDAASGTSMKQRSSNDVTDSSKDSSSSGEPTKSKAEQFHNVGRSNSAPDSYEWQMNGRQISSDSLLPPVRELSYQDTETEKR